MAQNDAPVSNNAVNIENKNNENIKQVPTHQFSVGSFNVWCPHWNGSESKHPQIWKKRHNDILNILCNNDIQNENKNEEKKNNEKNIQAIQAMNCDIYCLQEFWCDSEPFVRMYENYLKARDYSLHFLKRNNKYKPDGIAILINNKTFKLINKINYAYTISNRVVMLVQLMHLKSKCVINIANTHLTFPQDEFDHDLRAEQARQMIQLLQKNTSESVSIVMACGDFNCEINGNESVQCLNDGYKSSFHIANANNKSNVVSHYNHENESVFVDHIFYKKNSKVSKEDSFGVIPINSYLYPQDMKCDKWNDKWTLSDHRPIVSTFEIKHE